MDQTISHFNAATAIDTEKGWEGAYALVNRQTGKRLTMTLWETEEDMEATVSLANQIRGQAAGIAGSPPATVEVFEVARTLLGRKQNVKSFPRVMQD